MIHLRPGRRIRLFLAVVCALFFTKNALAGDLRTTLSTDSNLAASGTLVFTIENTSQYPAKVLTWYTPLEKKFNSDMFLVVGAGKPIAYTGRLVKRATPQESDFVIIEPGGSVSATITLPEGYDMTMLGQYEASYQGIVQYQLLGATSTTPGAAAKAQAPERSNKLILEVTTLPKPRAATKQAAVYTTCTAEQTATLDMALTEAERLAQEAYNALSTTSVSARPEAGRYQSWFGAYTSDRYQTALTTFSSISSTLTNQTIEFDCSCSDDYFAWVSPNQPYTIHICNAFWQADMTGTDSQAGTIIHELSHFTVVADTDDHVYGQTGAYNLARTTPDYALDNADNNEYFAEGEPFLPMSPLTPLQDVFADAVVVTCERFYSLADSSSASKEVGEPNHAGQSGGKSLWLAWQAPASGMVEASTVGGILQDTLLAVYTGANVATLSQIAANDDFDSSSGIFQSQLEFHADAGQLYHIAVDDYRGTGGIIYLALTSQFGDINGDETLGLTDAVLGLQLLSGQTPSEPVSSAADINDDGDIGLAEAIYTLRRLAL